MNRDTTKVIAAVTIGLGLATIAYRASQPPKKPGRGTWKAKKETLEYDYIIIGGGTAGCVLASRLTENENVRVLVLEAGDDNDDSYKVRTPMMAAFMFESKWDWRMFTVPQVYANNRSLKHVRGKMLGGCSSLNGMGYIRGPASDFDRWADDFGNPGWSYEEVLPYFKKAECFHDPALPSDHPRGPKTNRVHDPETETFEPEYHGTEGPWNLTYQYLNGASRGFMRANEAEGVPRNYDVNGSSSLGVFRHQLFIQPNAIRHSLSNAYLGKNKNLPKSDNRPNLRIVLKTHVEKILIENINGVQTAVGAVFRDERNVLHKVYAKSEVILSAGVFHSPPILLASGIGHQIHQSIPLIHPLPGVGRNLTDHMALGIVYRCPLSVDTVQQGVTPWKFPRHVYNYFRNGTGILTSVVMDAASYVRLEDIAPEFVAREKANGTWKEMASGPKAPDIELMFIPCTYTTEVLNEVPNFFDNKYTIVPALLNPASRGSVTTKVTVEQGKKKGDSYLRVEPVLDPNILSDAFDMRVMKEAVKFARRVGKHMQRDPEMAGIECFPTEAAVPDDDDEALENFIRQHFASFFHPTGTCAMGPASNPMAVVDNRLRVHGIDRLRVVDSSIMPKVIAGHTCATVVMIAEKASDMIKQDALIRQATTVTPSAA
ncbi:hypothetical protein BGZ52_002116 [Haplosporangium bisporale]|nr:hypothetical protein BGZ52_002116 [Haplosporangium bisporale]KAI9232893.1 MAG: hypothetical protein BYD32DRAFT_427326 [Podila humilis]